MLNQKLKRKILPSLREFVQNPEIKCHELTIRTQPKVVELQNIKNINKTLERNCPKTHNSADLSTVCGGYIVKRNA